MIEALHHAPEGVLAFKAIGKVRAKDYDQVLKPAIDRVLAAGQKIRVVVVLGPEFDGYTSGAEWDDARLALSNLRQLERCAMVSDRDWVEHLVKGLAWMMGGRLKLFAVEDLPAAMTWAASG